MNKLIELFLMLTIASSAYASSIPGALYGKRVFYDDVSVGSWVAISNITADTTDDFGTYTSGTNAFIYQICGTNRKGRLPLSTNINISFVGSSTTNAVTLDWSRYDGLTKIVIRKSDDAEVTWEWLTLTPSTETWTDDGANIWLSTDFTNLHSTLAPDPDVPWEIGDVVGPSSAVSDNIATFDGVTGKLIQDGGTSISDLQLDISNRYTKAEVDALPVSTFTNDAGYAILATLNTSNWDSAFSWVDFNSNGVSYLFTRTNEWNEAYGYILLNSNGLDYVLTRTNEWNEAYDYIVLNSNGVNYILSRTNQWNDAYSWGDWATNGLATTNWVLAQAYLDTLSGHNVTELDDVSNAGSGIIITSGERTTLGTALQNGDSNTNLINDAGYLVTGGTGSSTNLSDYNNDVPFLITELDPIWTGVSNQVQSDITNAQATADAALPEADVDADIKTFALPANTTISAYGKTLVDDADAGTARGTLDVDQAGTDNSTNVTLSGDGSYLSIVGQDIAQRDLAESDITNLTHYTDVDFDSRLATKTTTDLTEGANLYYSIANAEADGFITNALNDVDVTNAFVSADTVVSNGVTSAFIAADTVISNAVIASSLQKTGGTMTGAILTDIDYLTIAPAADEIPSAGWVRSLTLGGAEWYFTDTTNASAWAKTTNFVDLKSSLPAALFTNSIASPVASDTYLVGGITTQLYGSLRSPMFFEIYMNRVGGNASTVIPVHPEIYYVYQGTTNQLGDWEVADQTITATTSTKYTYTVSFTEPTLTSSVQVVSYLKSGTVSGTAAGLNVYGGDGEASHMNIKATDSGESFADSLHINGDNAMTGDLNMGGQDITNALNVNATTGTFVRVNADTGNTGTNTYGGLLTQLGQRVQSGGGTASGDRAHAEGITTVASGGASHAEGGITTASGDYSHAEGFTTVASGDISHAAGRNATAGHDNTYVWSDGTVYGSTTTKQFSVTAENGIRLDGGDVIIANDLTVTGNINATTGTLTSATVADTATAGTEVVNYQTMTGMNYAEKVENNTFTKTNSFSVINLGNAYLNDTTLRYVNDGGATNVIIGAGDYTYVLEVAEGGATKLLATELGDDVDMGGNDITNAADMDITGTYKTNGVALAFGGSQTPWTSNVDGGGFSLTNAGHLGIISTNTTSEAVTVIAPTAMTTDAKVITVERVDGTDLLSVDEDGDLAVKGDINDAVNITASSVVRGGYIYSGTQSYFRLDDMRLVGTTPSLILDDNSAGKDNYIIANDSDDFSIENDTLSTTAFYVDDAGNEVRIGDDYNVVISNSLIQAYAPTNTMTKQWYPASNRWAEIYVKGAVTNIVFTSPVM